MGERTVVETEGHRQVRAIVKVRGINEVARKLGTTTMAIRNWMNAIRNPNAECREKLAALYGIHPIKAWERPKETKPPAAPVVKLVPRPLASGRPTEGMTAKDQLRRTIGDIEGDIQRARDDGASPRELAPLYGTLVSAQRAYGRFTGEMEVTEASLLRSTVFAKAMRILREALEPYPDAAEAVEKAFADFENGAA